MEIPAPGKLTFSVHQVAASIAPGAATVTGGSAPGDREDRDGNAGLPMGRQASMIGWAPVVGVEARFAVGLFRPCEGAVMVGISRLAGELRCGLAGAERGPPVALAGAVGYVPFFSRDGWWGRLELDVSTPRAAWQLLFGPALTWGPEAYALPSGAEEDFSLPSDADGPYSQVRRTEVRLSMALGVAYSGASPEPSLVIDGIELRGYRGTTWILGIVPFVTLTSSDARRACVGCSTGDVARFDAGWGAAVVVGVARFDPDGMPSPFAPSRARMQ